MEKRTNRIKVLELKLSELTNSHSLLNEEQVQLQKNLTETESIASGKTGEFINAMKIRDDRIAKLYSEIRELHNTLKAKDETISYLKFCN